MSAPNPAYRATAWHATRGTAEIQGGLIVTPHALLFESEQANFAIPFDRLVIDLVSKRRLCFTDPDQPELTIHTTEERVLLHPLFRQQGHLQGRIDDIRKTMEGRTILKLSMVFLAVFGVAILGLWAVSGLVVGVVTDRIPVAWEVEISKTVMQQIEPRLKTVNDPVWSRRLEAMVKRLTQTMPVHRYEFKIQILDHPTPNAFALPGGRIFVHNGLLKTASQPEEIAGVLAHEMAHVNLRHGLRQLIKSSVPRFLSSVFFGDQQGFIALASEGSQLLLQQHYSREFERQADRTGWQYLMDARIDPRGMIAFFKKLEADPELSRLDNPALQVFNSHPPTRERIQYLESLWDASPKKSGFQPVD